LEGADSALDILGKIEAGFQALEVIVNDLLQFTSHRDPVWRRFDLASLVHEVCESLAPQLAAQQIHMELDVPAGVLVDADHDLLRRAILNLVLNALDAMPRGGQLAVTAWQSPHCFELEVADSGPGLARDQIPRLFEPFFTTKDGGTGLGLAIVDRIATLHGGRVSACNCPQGGAAFTIQIPQRRLEAAA
jgi:signal transduction histidine kinase